MTADGADDVRGVRLEADRRSTLQPWQFFVLAALVSATVATFLLRVQGIAGSVLLTALMGAAALAGFAALRTLRPLFTAGAERPLVGQRTRDVLERDKMLTLRTIKELEFDRAMGKLSVEDFQEMSGRLRARAGRLMRQLETADGYRERIERDVAKRMKPGPKDPAPAQSGAACASCSTVNDPDARFCKNCGTKL